VAKMQKEIKGEWKRILLVVSWQRARERWMEHRKTRGRRWKPSETRLWDESALDDTSGSVCVCVSVLTR
jgi:hypothetical protein